jgi:hypothetical protein
MSNSGERDIWTPPRLRARLAERKGQAPAPRCFIIWRVTTRANGTEIRGYQLPGDHERRDEAAFERWLLERNLAGAERLSVSVLVIREQLDAAGLVREGVLERRRGGVDGPYHGNVARIEFTGAAGLVRRYRAGPEGRLTELPAADPTGVTPPRADMEVESFSGEDAAVHEFLGPGAVIVDRRPPTLFEDLLGLSAVIHTRRPDGTVIGCGVGWHGDTAFVLAAGFPRHGGPLAPPAELEAAVENALRTRDLIRHETRIDELGYCVIARERGGRGLVIIRLEGKATRIDPYVPGRGAARNDDQLRWMTYAETYEARTILDSWSAGEGDEITVLTIDPDLEAWHHVIDADGVEISRQSDNEAAAAAIYRERFGPPEAPRPDVVPAMTPPPRPRPSRPEPSRPEPSRPGPSRPEFSRPGPSRPGPSRPGPSRPGPSPGHLYPAIAPETDAPSDSLLTKALAWSHAMTLLGQIRADVAARHTVPHVASERLSELIPTLSRLNVPVSIGLLRRLIDRVEAGTIAEDGIATSLDESVALLQEELALTRIAVLSSAQSAYEADSPFGPSIEIHFPAATYDIEEAIHCLALRRSTACVLHAMQVMRHGLARLESILAIPNLADLPWTRLIAAVRDVAAHRDLASALVSVRHAWHAPGLLPAAKYTEEEAEAVLTAVAEFMRLLADRFDTVDETIAD